MKKICDNVTAMELDRDESMYNCRKKADETIKRFLYCSEVLPENDTIGWQFSADNYRSHIFLNSKNPVSGDDLEWIFNKCAKTVSKEDASLENPFKEGRAVYLIACSEGEALCKSRSNKYDDYDLIDEFEDSSEIDLFRELLYIMHEAGAIMRFSITPNKTDSRNNGQILISLPDKMTLRMRTMLSRALPCSEIVEYSEDSSDRIYPKMIFSNGMKGLLCALMLRPEDAEVPDEVTVDVKSEMSGNDETNNSDSTTVVNHGSLTPIEDADFSARIYHSLKRAGIDSMEKLEQTSDEELRKIRNLTPRCIEEIKKKLAEYNNETRTVSLEADSYMDMLDGLIGLDEVKMQIKKVAALARMKKALAESGQRNIPVNLNMEFVGNPGTAKTTAARIIAGIFYEIGLLPSKEMIEVGRADLVAKYMGQTAIQVKEVFKKAKGKLLFIDEAYSLLDDRAGEYGDEAIHTIVQEMENRRNDTVVIFAGYPDKMKAFFERNPGLRSRVPFHIHFSDYSAEEMLKIVELEAEKRGFAVCPDAHSKILDVCSVAAKSKDAGNGRLCRNLVENAILSYASRVYSGSGECIVCERILDSEDFPENYIIPGFGPNTGKQRIGFCA